MKVSKQKDQHDRLTQKYITESLRIRDTISKNSIDYNQAFLSNSPIFTSKSNQLKMPQLVTRSNNFQEYQNFEYQSSNTQSRARSKQSDDLISSYILDLNDNGDQKQLLDSLQRQTFSRPRYASQLKGSEQDRNFSTINKSLKKETGQCYRKSSFSSSNQSKQFAGSPKQDYQFPKIQIRTLLLQHTCSKFRLIGLVIGRIIRLYKFVKRANLSQKSLIKSKLSTKETKIDSKQSYIEDRENKIKRKWVEPALQKVFFYFKSLAFQSKDADAQDQRELWTGNLIKFLFQNLELITRKGNIPKQIIQEMSKGLVKDNQNKVSLFTAQRTNFFLFNMTKKENQLIASEYIIFEIFIRYFLEVSNELKYQSFAHKIECKIKVIELVSLIQMHFMKYFENMPLKEKKCEIQLFQRILSISTDDDQNITINESQEVDDSGILILGLKDNDHFKQLLTRKHKWKQNMRILFDRIIDNIYTQLEIDFSVL